MNLSLSIRRGRNLIILILVIATCVVVLQGRLFSADASSDTILIAQAPCAVSFAAETNFSVSNAPYSITKSDFNGDGKVDLLTTSQLSNNISVLLGTGTGSFAPAVNFSVGSGSISVAVGEFNGDGKIDVVTANQFGNSVSILLGTGTGSFSSATSFSVGSPPRWVAVGDLNGDSKLDLVTANQDDSVSVLLGNGAGSFGAATHFVAGSASGSSPFAVSVGDFNSDQKLDLAVANTNTANVSILMGAGNGTFSAPTNFAVGSNPRFIAIADFNGDSKPDLAVANTFSSNISILLGTGTGSFGVATNFSVGGPPWSIAVGDFNSDGTTDLATANFNPSNVTLLTGFGTGSFGNAVNFTITSFPDSVVAGDFNSDSKLDLATGNNGSSNVSVLLNSAASCATPTPTPVNGKIAFVRDGQILTINPDGTGAAPFFATHMAEERSPAWSRDGSKLAFVSGVTTAEIFIVNADGSGLTRLTNDAGANIPDNSPTWSPDGHKIAWQRTPIGSSFPDIYIMDSVDANSDGNGDNRLQITNFAPSNNSAGKPSWSPDGTKIAFARSFAGGSQQIATMNIDGTNQIPVPTATGPNADDDAAWSPDGNKIAFRRNVNGTHQVLVVNVNGSGETVLTNDQGSSQREPAWSPDGAKIAFSSDKIIGSNKEIFVMNADGTNPIRVTNNPGIDELPSWQGSTSVASAPPNDNIQNAQTIVGATGSVNGDNTGGTRQLTNFFPAFGQAVEPLHARYGHRSVWYRWTAPSSGAVRFWIEGVNFDSLLGVYNATTIAAIPGILPTDLKLFNPVASNDDFDFGQTNQLLSLVTFTAKNAETYYIAFDSINNAGVFSLHWNQNSQSLQAVGGGARISGLVDSDNKSLVAIQVGRTAPLTAFITGSGFTATSVVQINEDVCRRNALNNCISGTQIQSSFQNSGRLQVTVPAAYFAQTQDLTFRVVNGNQVAANRALLHVSCIEVFQPQPGQTLNTNGPGAQCPKPAHYSLLATNDTTQPLTFTVNILDLIDTHTRVLAGIPNLGLPGINLNLLIANAMRAGYGLPPLDIPLALPGGQVVGGGAINIMAQPTSVFSCPLDLIYKPNVFLIGQDGTSLIGQDGTSIDRNRATIVASSVSNILATDGATILATDGATIVAGGAGNILATDGATFGPGGGGNAPSHDAYQSLSDNTLVNAPAVDISVRRTGWYVFPDSQGGNSNLKPIFNQDGTISLEADITVNANTLPRTTDLNQTAFAIVLNPSYLSFSQSSYSVSEGTGQLTIAVNRTNNLADPAIVSYSTSSRAEPAFAAPVGTASERSDYSSTTGTLFFAPGETQKTFTVFITDDGLGGADDGASEAFNVLLNNAYGAVVDGKGSVQVTITDNDVVSATNNPVDDAAFFVRQHYIDFLNREPDPSGLAFWTNQITECESRPQAERQPCRETRLINVSAAFFLSIEFQETGFLVNRLHAASFGAFPASLSLREFVLGTRSLGRDVVVGAPGWEQTLESNKQAFLNFWVARPEFVNIYGGKTSDDYVNTLFANAGVTTDQETTLRSQLIAGLDNGSETRASALRKVAESPAVSSRLLNPSFVLVQYMGYLRRGPNEIPDSNFDGYNFWLNKLNEFGGNFQNAEMVKAFINSGEYRGRFGK
jgi:Tol biopolymer transport system component